MNDDASGPDLFDRLAHDFAERYRRGEQPPLSEYTDKYPELAEQIRDLFPALVVMEQLGCGAGEVAANEPVLPITSDTPRHLGEYRILREIARGGMGVVYEAVQESLGRHVALKILPSHCAEHDLQLERFRREARAAARLHHTNIVPVFGVGEDNGIHYYAMQYIQGQTLASVLREINHSRAPVAAGSPTTGQEVPNEVRPEDHDRTADLAQHLLTGEFGAVASSPPTVDEAHPGADALPQLRSSVVLEDGAQSQASWVGQPDALYFRSVAKVGGQVAEALAYAHQQGILHRDIKPSNLLLDLHGTVWVTDFGLAKAEDTPQLTNAGDIVGTVAYMPPERFRGVSEPRGDVYSLGLTLFEMATLRAAYAESDQARLLKSIMDQPPPRPRLVNPHIPRDLETIVLKSIAREPAQRYATAAALAEDLQRFLDGRPIRAQRTIWIGRVWRWCRRNPVVASLLTAVLLLLAAIAVVATVSAHHLHQEQQATSRQLKLTEKAQQLAEQRSNENRRALERLRSSNQLVVTSRFHAAWTANTAQMHNELTAAVKLNPDHALIWLERGDLYLQLGLWSQAAHDYDKAYVILGPISPLNSTNAAMLQLFAGNVKSYRHICRHMLARWGENPDPLYADDLARVLALSPKPVCDPVELMRIANVAVTKEPNLSWNHFAKAIAQYRAGQFANVVPTCRRFVADTNEPFWPLLALAHFRLGELPEARQALKKSEKYLDQWCEETFRFSAAERSIRWFHWMNWQLHYGEAKQLIDGARPSDDPRLLIGEARAWAALKERMQADAACRRALQLPTANAKIRMACFRIYTNLGWWERALAVLAGPAS